MTRRWVTFVVVFFGFVAPIATLVYGWAYASVRENRLKERWVEELEARHDPRAAYERTYMVWHRRIEEAGLGGLVLVLVGAAWTTWIAARRQRELSAKKAAFVAAVTHELRTPLTTLRMHAEMLEGGLVAPERTARVYAELSREAARLSRVVENVLAMSKLEDGRWVLDKRRADLAAAVGTIAATLEPRAKDRGFALRVSAEPGDVEVELDPRALELVVQNLVDNALKFAADGEPREIDVRVVPGDSAVELVVRDHGPGIAPELRERVFDRFDRAGHSDKPGTGLGLALVRELARAHGGDARVVEGPGAAIAVTFPRRPRAPSRDG